MLIFRRFGHFFCGPHQDNAKLVKTSYARHKPLDNILLLLMVKYKKTNKKLWYLKGERERKKNISRYNNEQQ